MNLKKWIKNIQNAGYNGVCTVPRYKIIRYNFSSIQKRFLPHCEIACVPGNCLGTKFSNMTWKLSKPINPGRNLSTLWISTAYLPAIQYMSCTVCTIFAEICRQNLLNYIIFCLEFMTLLLQEGLELGNSLNFSYIVFISKKKDYEGIEQINAWMLKIRFLIFSKIFTC